VVGALTLLLILQGASAAPPPATALFTRTLLGVGMTLGLLLAPVGALL
jgi:hypothetical protein